MAHLREIQVDRCGKAGYNAVAAVRLYSDRNDVYGFYCKRHGGQALRKLQAEEQARYAREGAREGA